MKRNKFSLSHYKLTTFDQGELVPCGLVEVLPGDTFQQATSVMLRVSPMLAPMMHPVRVRIHHWFVPTRLIWDDFEKFITGGPDGLDASVLPTKNLGTVAEGSLADYFGIPTGVANTTVSILPFRAYNLICNNYYLDQDLQTQLVISKASGNDTTTNVTLQNSCWEKDFFTTCRPWTQKGSAVSIPLIGQATVRTQGADLVSSGSPDAMRMRKKSDNAYPTSGRYMVTGTNGATNGAGTGVAAVDELYPANLYADLTGVTTATVNQLRASFALQRFAENRARFGSRYTEYLRSLGVGVQDARLDRPEYLGGGRQTIQISEVLQTGTNFGDNNGVGTMRGHGIGAMRSNRYRRHFMEHGYIISLINVLPKTIYAQGLPKLWSRATNEDFFQKELQHIGQQEVYNREVYLPHSTPSGIFGYQNRYDDYRRMESGISGEFRSTLQHWHMARIFASDPALNASFVAANPTKRMLASTSTDGIYCMINHSIQARRIVDTHGAPI